MNDEIMLDEALERDLIKDSEYVTMLCNDGMIIAILDIKTGDRFTLCLYDSHESLRSIFINALHKRLYRYSLQGGFIVYRGSPL